MTVADIEYKVQCIMFTCDPSGSNSKGSGEPVYMGMSHLTLGGGPLTGNNFL